MNEAQAPKFKVGAYVPEGPDSDRFAAIAVFEDDRGRLMTFISYGLVPGVVSPLGWQVTTIAYGQFLLDGGEITDMKTVNRAMDMAKQEQREAHALKLADDPRGRFRVVNISKLFAKYMKQLTVKQA